jgi:hypothetical protein
VPLDESDSSQTAVSAFSRPESELTSLVLSVENILRNYFGREPRFPVDPENEDLVRLCGYRSEFDGNFTQLEDRLNNKLTDTAYSAHSNYELSIEDLGEILDEEYYSLPLVELDPRYYKEAEYIVQPGQYGANEIPILIPVSVDEGQVTYWDPFVDFYFGGPDDTMERAISDTKFIKLWSDASKTNWTFWIDRAPQQTLSGFSKVDA